jgi:aminomethyltransferase
MESSHREPRKTPLFAAHQALGARLIDFGGWWMPVQYPKGIIAEHTATRTAVGVFDVCHMGEVHFRGPRAVEAVSRLVTGDVGALAVGHALYTVACWPSGGIVDDLIVYKLGAEHLLAVVNAANVAKDVGWFHENVGGWCAVEDASEATGLLAFQGPAAARTLQGLTDAPLARVAPFDVVPELRVAGIAVTLARTGYTAEDGFELFCATADVPALWDRLIRAADDAGGAPVGLGARDTLRLEGRLSLYGNDLDDRTTPLEAGLGWVVKLDGADFIGKQALLAQRAAGVRRRLSGFVMVERGVARHGYAIHAAAPSATGGGGASDAGVGQRPGQKAGQKVGTVTSGGPGPTVGKNIGLGYLPTELSEPGTRLFVDCRGKLVEAEVVKGPFYKRAR